MIKNFILIKIFCFIFLFQIFFGYGQGMDEIDTQTWLDFRAYYIINDDWTYDGDYGVRGIISGEDWQRVYINPSAVYDLNISTVLRGGMRFIYTHEINTSNTFEIRPWQGIRFIWPRTKYFIISQYVRLEQRITFHTQEGNSDFALRARYRIMAKTPNLRWEAINQVFYLFTSFEFFSNVGKAIEETFVDRTRLTFGLGYIISQAFRMELNYTFQGSRGGNEEGIKIGVHIIRLRLKYYVN
jgi:hypothetical protein